MIMELMAPGFVIFFFGLSAATVGLCRFAFDEAMTLSWQLASFSLFSILYLTILRRLLKNIFKGDTSHSASNFNEDFIGRTGVVTKPIEPPAEGRVEIGDAEWSAISDSSIPSGAEVRVLGRDNLTMKVEKL